MLLDIRREDFFRPFRELQREIDRLFDDFFRTERREHTSFLPDVDIYEDDNKIYVEVEVPGMNKEDVKVKIEDNVLTIFGEKKQEKESKKHNYHVVERSYGTFQRSFALPDYVDTEKIKASYDKGVLKIEIPKKESAKPKVIDVRIE
ncbi:MAG: Hsp20/alpha crystallin family protein [Thermotogae bacterium]|nr:MAG: Hsp20/alpha crystallin family protein [Thermotogota bacterium]